MSTESWIVVAVVAVLLILAAAGGALLVSRKRKISLAPKADSKPEASTYQAKGGFSFSEGGSGATTLEPPPARIPEAPKEPAKVEATRPGDQGDEIQGAPGRGAPEERDTRGGAEPETEAWAPTGLPGVGDDASTPVDSPKPTLRDVKLPEPTAEPEPEAAEPEVEPEPEHVAEPEPEPEPVLAEPKAEAAPEEPPAEEIVPSGERWGNLRGRLARSQNSVGRALVGLLGGGDLDEESWEDVEATLLTADLGASTTEGVIEKLREALARSEVRSEAEARAVLKDVLVAELKPEFDRSVRALPHADRPSVVLVVGVNGTGKTTTTGKLARVLVADGRRVLLGAADTFRAAAVEQLKTWGQRVGAEVVAGAEGADPASVAFEAVSRGVEAGADVVLIDTAGRLHTKTGLMDELGKIKRVVERKAGVDEVILVLDATIGQNGLLQAKVFSEVVDVTGVALTKLDGTAKGGIVFAVQKELGVPVKLVGLGEGKDDLAPFEPNAFVDALLG
ncbi:signal recognition particle-docking protein FtsY [Segniliparus rugosus]|uniref:Signal recognition particle receptor FtsY n=1 Tax=Segniliparus rugosus (strain ATCC BAA-974 / DSM 45345 / CCUG 50838 / CIP 108380 / JCM 13579 / CDC 945) TaxID=679197 RepID=E5XL79_SEGRC|nr:signal recognition particle-docking protein FtsY [Segniliparus rugosus]EFV14895.1 signal recognition particle-docking protein FtsY [Segniliparus rugosus ATCC BAA-974]